MRTSSCPAPFALEHDHYDLLLNALSVRNVARYSPPVSDPPASGGRIGRSCLTWRPASPGVPVASGPDYMRWRPRPAAGHASAGHRRRAPVRPLRGRAASVPERLSLSTLERAGRTIDLGPLQPGRLPRLLFTKGKRILLAPEPMLTDLHRVDASFSRPPPLSSCC
jgi:hypothetical protein